MIGDGVAGSENAVCGWTSILQRDGRKRAILPLSARRMHRKEVEKYQRTRQR